jgi:hypothetical protein
MGIADDQDVAKRCVFYGNAEMTIPEMESGYSKDYATFIFSALRNDNVFLNPKQRAFLEDRLSDNFAWTYKERCEQIHKKRSWFDPRPLSEQEQAVTDDMLPDIIPLKPTGNATPTISASLFKRVKFWAQMASIWLGMTALVVASATANAFVLVMLWGWYITPYFSLPSLNMIHAFGLFWIVSLFTKKTLPGSAENNASIEGLEHPMMSASMAIAINPGISLLIGWIGTFWLP